MFDLVGLFPKVEGLVAKQGDRTVMLFGVVTTREHQVYIVVWRFLSEPVCKLKAGFLVWIGFQGQIKNHQLDRVVVEIVSSLFKGGSEVALDRQGGECIRNP